MYDRKGFHLSPNCDHKTDRQKNSSQFSQSRICVGHIIKFVYSQNIFIHPPLGCTYSYFFFVIPVKIESHICIVKQFGTMKIITNFSLRFRFQI